MTAIIVKAFGLPVEVVLALSVAGLVLGCAIYLITWKWPEGPRK